MGREYNRRMRFGLCSLVVGLLSCLSSSFQDARADAPPGRSLTLPGGAFALDLGLGLGHLGRSDVTGFGLNLGLHYGLTSALELGIRTGVRFDNDGQIVQADEFGRTYDTQTHGAGHDSWANPELLLRGLLLRGTVDLALEGRMVLPAATDTRIGLMLGLPVLLHLGSQARIDTGIYVPLWFDPSRTVVSLPVQLWISTGAVYLGPSFGWQHDSQGDTTKILLGFALGKNVSGGTDLRSWFLFPDVGRSGGARTFGAGVGLHVRF